MQQQPLGICECQGVFESVQADFTYTSAILKPATTRTLDARESGDDAVVVTDLLGGTVEADLFGAINIGRL